MEKLEFVEYVSWSSDVLFEWDLPQEEVLYSETEYFDEIIVWYLKDNIEARKAQIDRILHNKNT